MASDYDKMAHLWRRAAFGARPDEVNTYLQQGFEATVDLLLNYDAVTEDASIPARPVTTIRNNGASNYGIRCHLYVHRRRRLVVAGSDVQDQEALT